MLKTLTQVINLASFREWLDANTRTAKERTDSLQIVRDDLQKLEKWLKNNLKLNDIHYDCAWNVEHLRGCLKSLVHLHKMHTNELKCLEGEWQLNKYLGRNVDHCFLTRRRQ